MINIYKVTSFTDNKHGGNPAGLVFDADKLSAKDMLKIAADIGFSETAFVMESKLADFKVRFFTPVDEVDLCGHATVATFNILRDKGMIKEGLYTQETKAGILKVFVNKNDILMEQKSPVFSQVLSKSEIQKCFTNLSDDLFLDKPIQVVSTGLRDIIVPVKDLESLLNLDINFQAITKLSLVYDVTGIHVFTLDTQNVNDAHVRNFAPRYGINEESATGTSNGALSCYLMKNFKDEFTGEFQIEQGYSLNSPSIIRTKIQKNNNGDLTVLVGGSAVLL